MDLFRRACGLGDPLALVCQKVGSSTGAYMPLDYPRPFLLIGRDAEADLSLNDALISRRHAFLQVVAGRVSWIDLESRTKVLEEGQEVPQPHGWLDPGRFIQVGAHRLHRTDRPAGSRAIGPFTDSVGGGLQAISLPRPRLELPFRLGGKTSTWEIDGLQALMGRSDQCQLVLTDASISRYHASLVCTPLGLWVVDLLAREGVHVNDTRVRWAWLAEGDELRLGRFTLTVRYDGPLETISRKDVPLAAGASPVAFGTRYTGVPSSSPGHEPRALAIRSGSPRAELLKLESPSHAFPVIRPAGSIEEEWQGVMPAGGSSLAMWRQQMQLMETFHNDMLMMVQMFVSMRREHEERVHDELSRVEQLTQELARLNARLVQVPGQRTVRPNPETDRASSQDGPARSPGSSKPFSTPRDRSTPVSTKEPVPQPRDRRANPSVTRPAAGLAESEATSAAAAPAPHGPELYVQLTQRIAELQRERQGYWQRILNVINGSNRKLIKPASHEVSHQGPKG